MQDKTLRTLRHPALHLGMALAALVACTNAVSQTPAAADQRYHQEMANCANGRSQQDADTCRREAVNALAEARKNQLTTPSPAASSDAALQRCKALPANQQSECMARMREGTVEGSVGGGGVLREHITTIPPRAVVP